eukprot:gb/GFBE01005189.1/.p1 GENE.gb/GFBE01005189.1/~~gb/GFBE01005189.1/.p1  ORF type:complete len:214 (+),score=50.86 gb/GFBE01005189.1/:1-642(+)
MAGVTKIFTLQLLIMSSCVLYAAASRGEEDSHDDLSSSVASVGSTLAALPETKGVKSPAAGIAEMFSAANDWFFLSGPAPMVGFMSKRGQLRTLFVFGLALFAMATQIQSALQMLKKGMSQLTKMDEEAAERRASAVATSPIAFAAAAAQEEEQQRQRIADWRKEVAARRLRQLMAAPAYCPQTGRRAHSVPHSSQQVQQVKSNRRSRSASSR